MDFVVTVNITPGMCSKGTGEVWNKCGNSCSSSTCEEYEKIEGNEPRVRVCTADCRSMCVCPENKPAKLGNICVPLDQCRE